MDLKTANPTDEIKLALATKDRWFVSQRLKDGKPRPVEETKAKRPADYGSKNTVFTKEAADAARALPRKKLAKLNAGLDSDSVRASIMLAGYHVEAGARITWPASSTRSLVTGPMAASWSARPNA